jgi:hypothetical protein
LAFLRFSRDKRGYEHFYLVEATTNRRGKTRTRVLYWFRTPPGVKVGREPFDDDVRAALEAQNPDVEFDWRKIVETPIPSADVERWRERRRIEKAEKAARRARAADGQPIQSAVGGSAVSQSAVGESAVEEFDDSLIGEPAPEFDGDGDDLDEQIAEGEEIALDAAERQEDALPPVIDPPTAAPAPPQQQRRRRRRRGSRGSQGSLGSQGSSGSEGSSGSSGSQGSMGSSGSGGSQGSNGGEA